MRCAMLRLVSVPVLCFMFVSALPGYAQAPAPAVSQPDAATAKQSSPAIPVETPKYTTRTQLVLVPVVVTDKNGEHAAGLNRSAFTIQERGKTREATVFEEVKTVAPDAKARSLVALEGRSNFPAADVQNWRVTIVVVDMLNTPYLYLPGGKQHLVDFLSKTLSKSLQRGEPTAVFGLGTNGLKLLHPFTSDTAVLLDALQQVEGQVSPHAIKEQPSANHAEGAEFQRASHQTAQRISDFINEKPPLRFYLRDNVWITLTAMTQVAQAYSAIPGRKAMLWASGGVPFLIDDETQFQRMGQQTMAKYDETWRALASAQIAAYPVDMAGLSDANSSMYVRYGRESRRKASLLALAAATGGTACVKMNDVDGCIQRAVNDSHAYYLLGYYLPPNDQKPGWRKLKVKVASSEARVLAREGFYVPEPLPDTPDARQHQILEALSAPVEYTGVRLNVREVQLSAGSKSAAAGKSVHEFQIGILGNSLTVDAQNHNAVDATVAAIAFTPEGRNAASNLRHFATNLDAATLQKIRTTGLSMNQTLELAPGKYELRFAVRDNLNGALGTVQYPIEVK